MTKVVNLLSEVMDPLCVHKTPYLTLLLRQLVETGTVFNTSDPLSPKPLSDRGSALSHFQPSGRHSLRRGFLYHVASLLGLWVGSVKAVVPSIVGSHVGTCQ